MVSQEGMRCVIVDDNQEFLDTAAGLLERGGITVVGVASNGDEALRSAAGLRPDLILVDLHLPGMTGEEVLERLWQDPSTRDIATVVLTADATPGLQRRLMAAGARDHLTKPLHVAHVLQIIDQYVPGKAVA